MTYDRPTANERKTMALELAKPKVKEGPADLEPVRPSHGPATTLLEISVETLWDSWLRTAPYRSLQFSWGVFKHSCQQTRSFFWGTGLLEVASIPWTWMVASGWSRKESLVNMKVAPAKGRAYGQQLLTSLRTIHIAVMDGKQECWPSSQTRKTKTKWEL